MQDLLQNVHWATRKLEEFFGEPRRDASCDPLDGLILTILSQNTNDANRDLAYARLRERFSDWYQLAEAPLAEIAAVIRPAGLGNQKAQTLKSLLQWLRETYGSLNLDFLCDLPPEEAQRLLTSRKGIGIKTISVVLMACCGADVFPVDTHVHRICRRLGWVPPNASAEKTHHLMQPLVPKGKAYSLHMNLLKLGRTLCKAQKPRCHDCPLAERCPSAGTF